MMSMTVWGTLRVDQFFKAYNWLGLPPSLEATHTKSETLEQPSWLCLSVEEFLNQNNWRGQQTVSGSLDSRETAPILLTMPVGQFFQMAIWKGFSKSVVSKPPSKIETSVSNSPEYNLSDLSDLF